MLTLGVDIGQAIDPTAMIVLDSYRPSVPDGSRQPLQHLVRWIERVPLGTHYADVVERIGAVVEEATVFGSVLVVPDATGVGRAVVDMLQTRLAAVRRVTMRAVTFTAAHDEVEVDASLSRVPKRDLVTALEVVLQGRRLQTVPGLRLAEQLRAELANFDFNISPQGKDSYNAASGHHDDLVMALALALWGANRGGHGQAYVEYLRRAGAATERRNP